MNDRQQHADSYSPYFPLFLEEEIVCVAVPQGLQVL